MSHALCPGVKESPIAMELIKLVGEADVDRNPERRTGRRRHSSGRVRGVFAFLLAQPCLSMRSAKSSLFLTEPACLLKNAEILSSVWRDHAQ
jgi:hypothetical protein